MIIPLTRAAEGYSRRAFTVAEIARIVEAGIIAEDERFELIKGDIVPFSPNGNQHEVLKSALAELLVRQGAADLRIAVATTLYLSPRCFLEPDLCVYPKRLLPEDVKGYDILITIEIGGSCLDYDRGLKAGLYAVHGVRELWVIDAGRRATWVHKLPNPDGSWGSIQELAADAVLSPEAPPEIRIVLAGLD